MLNRFINKFTPNPNDECDIPLYGKSVFTTGILIKNPTSNTLRVTLLNQNKKTQSLSLAFYNWTSGTPECYFREEVYLPPYVGKVVDILLKEPYYGDSLDIDLFEVRVAPYNDKIKINISQIYKDN